MALADEMYDMGYAAGFQTAFEESRDRIAELEAALVESNKNTLTPKQQGEIAARALFPLRKLDCSATEAPSGTCDARVVRYDDYERCDRPGNPCDRHRVETKGNDLDN